MGVVGDEALVPLYHGVTTCFDVQAALPIEQGPAVPILHRDVGEPGKNVEFRQRGTRVPDDLRVGCEVFAKRVENSVFPPLCCTFST
jgi:hypothetical protein